VPGERDIKMDKLQAADPVNSGKCVEFSPRGHYHSLDLSHYDTGPDSPLRVSRPGDLQAGESSDKVGRVAMAEPVQTSDSPDKNVGKGRPVAQPGPQTRKDAFGSPMPSAGVERTPPGPAVPQEWAPQAIDDYARRLSEEHKMLVALKVQLYGGSWEPMLDDLRNRLAGKPYIFKLVHRIQDDIERIEEMRKFETEHKIDLAEYVDG